MSRQMSVIFVLCRAFLCVKAISVLADIKHFWMLKESKIKVGLLYGSVGGEARRGLMNLRQKKSSVLLCTVTKTVKS